MPTQTALERIMADATEFAENSVADDADAKADLIRLLQAGKRPWIVNVCTGYEIFLEFRKSEP